MLLQSVPNPSKTKAVRRTGSTQTEGGYTINTDTNSDYAFCWKLDLTDALLLLCWPGLVR